MVGTDNNKYDLPLSRKGINQAMEKADFFVKYFEDNNYHFDKIVIECSPFLRCMMTAAQIASSLGQEEVVINYRAAERQRAL